MRLSRIVSCGLGVTVACVGQEPSRADSSRSIDVHSENPRSLKASDGGRQDSAVLANARGLAPGARRTIRVTRTYQHAHWAPFVELVVFPEKVEGSIGWEWHREEGDAQRFLGLAEDFGCVETHWTPEWARCEVVPANPIDWSELSRKLDTLRVWELEQEFEEVASTYPMRGRSLLEPGWHPDTEILARLRLTIWSDEGAAPWFVSHSSQSLKWHTEPFGARVLSVGTAFDRLFEELHESI